MFFKNIESFIEFVKNNWRNIIKAGFIFQIKPLKANLKPIILNITPSSNGKANSFSYTCYLIKKIYYIITE